MKIYSLADFTGGWFVGDFLPTAHQTPAFEVGYKLHLKGDKWPVHYHKEATEINLLISGRMRLRGVTMEAGTVFVIEPGEIADPVFLKDCQLVVIKTPSIPGDKYEV